MLVPFCYIPASAAVFVVMERISKSKHLQLVSGANPRLYWLATFMWDLLVYLLVVSLCMVVFRVFNEPSLIGTFQQGAAIFCVLMLYGIAVLPLVYCYSFLFDSPTTAQISIIIFNFVAAFAMVIAHQIMKELPNTQAADAALVWLYRFLPGYNFGEAVINLTTNYYQGLLLGSAEPPFSWKVIGRPLLLMSFEAVGYFLLLLRIEASAQTYAKLEPCLALLCGVREPSIDLSRRSRFAIYAALILIVVVLSSNITQPGGGLLLAAIVLSTAAGVLWYERRLRRTGGTAEAHASAELSKREGGTAFDEESDVAAERARVAELVKSHDEHSRRLTGVEEAVLISGLRKVFPGRGLAAPKVAVVDLSLGIHPTECFGFLGVNGAGKTTTLSILTGDYLPSRGGAWLGGYHVVHGIRRVRERMGYCPQSDPLLELMTARETLTMFARLKNLPEDRIPSLVQQLLHKVTLTPYADRVCGTYSGGNKRKLSLAIALVGSPAVVFLDEPSSGMDPVSRRHMWDIIMRERKQRSIVLTTHSMEECEALCTRIGIMTAGRLQCLGGQQHLKSKYGGGYTLEMRVADAKAEALPARMVRLFPGAQLDQSHAGKLTYELPKFEATGGKSLAEVFETMERHKDALGILDYSASQPSLESIFLAIADKDINRKPREDINREDDVARATNVPARKDSVPPSLELHAMPQRAAAVGKQEDSSETERSG